MQTRRGFFGALVAAFIALRAGANPIPVYRLNRQAYSAETLRVMSAHLKFDSMLNRSWDQYFEERQPIGDAIKIVRPARFTGVLGRHDS